MVLQTPQRAVTHRQNDESPQILLRYLVVQTKGRKINAVQIILSRSYPDLLFVLKFVNILLYYADSIRFIQKIVILL